jgi:hypothetical protein
MFQNVFMDLKISKEKQVSLFFSIFVKIFVSFQKQIWIFLSFQFHTHVYM